ncbi:DUF262 domain-containing protein [Mucilaginibacter aquatilis]|uniref:DUF262 domain-containing protein n=1 Tax=Mucilaginibacter aquatilis TaxID=1517760 RepID=A0A6I4IDF9_9SPHI|nr:DUF262 domain-containing protein [Mucilaginibacter aquatilis]MVN91469.1 DUF262 domain-containing protein [Mucilaginibacter aquatilis]
MTMIPEPIPFTPIELNAIRSSHQVRTFNIPIYQRLYSWGHKEINRLLKDVLDAANKDPGRDYYIGNITLHHNKISQCFDIIDGQQRLTTLWLIGSVMRSIGCQGWDLFLLADGSPMLGFAARREDERFLRSLIGANIDEPAEIVDEDINLIMVDAIRSIKEFLRELSASETERLSGFFLRQVNMVAIFLPDSVDLNKYFEDMNNRGLQLESHHILKATLLSHIDPELQEGYGKIWDAVAQLDQYVEYGLDGGLSFNRAKLLNIDVRIMSFFNAGGNGSDLPTLETLIGEGVKAGRQRQKEEQDPDMIREKVGSIVNFPEFLLHCLKLFLKGSDTSGLSVEDKKLLTGFETYFNISDADRFIRHLFRCRILYDEHFIKSINTEQGYCWEIRGIRQMDPSKDEYVRTCAGKDALLVQLQAMLNVSTAPSLWFTKALAHLIQEGDDQIRLLEVLGTIDRSIAMNFLRGKRLSSVLNNGTGTNRYWFYNLDYILWKEWTTGSLKLPVVRIEDHREKIRNFQFRDNRSVEHIYPRNPAFDTWSTVPIPEGVDEKIKDRFGNLALISVNSNSGYNNQSPDQKRWDFIHRTNKSGIESLKLAFAYGHEDWSVAAMIQHEQDMMSVLRRYHNLPEEEPILSEGPVTQ